jgi:hypothetical protein
MNDCECTGTSGQLALESGAMAPDGFNSEGQLQGASASEGSLEVRTSKRRQLQPGFRAALVLNKCDAVREPGRLLDLARRLSDQSGAVRPYTRYCCCQSCCCCRRTCVIAVLTIAMGPSLSFTHPADLSSLVQLSEWCGTDNH